MKLNFSPRLNAAQLTLASSVFLALACNASFWRSFFSATGQISLARLPLHVASALLIVLLFNACLTLFNFRFVLKPVLIALFMTTSFAAYFMGQYGIQIDKSMIHNLLETDVREAGELFSLKLVLSVGLLGVLPSVVVWRTRLDFSGGWRGLASRLGIVAGSLILGGALLLMFFKSLAPALREHRELRYLLTPTNYIQAINSYVRQDQVGPVQVHPLGMDASRGVFTRGDRKRSITVIVVGETARAMNFSLNGYGRETNPQLKQQRDLINFTNVHSCGTATAVSLPCLFSVLGREDYSDAKAHAQEGLLDVLKHADFDVRWRDNNSGCKGACDRVVYEDLSKPEAGNRWCVDDECYDERMLDKLPEMIRTSSKDMVIVLHQKGSHGPAYWKRYPAPFQHFGPVCKTSELEGCSRASIVDAYDNTILYTDHFLSQTIDLLRASSDNDNVNTALMYFSDHGESLGENNMYLHGAPYFISPIEQRSVPMMLWLSEGYRNHFHIDQRCLAARSNQALSHDNVFHSVLGMLRVSTAVYNPRLDIFHACTHDA